MILGLIGLIVGLLMGITGAGGAIIAIPLFQLLLDSPLKEATVLSLITVILGTGVNLASRLNHVNWKLSIGLAVSGSLANFLSMPLKEKMPELTIALLLVLIGIFSIWSVWNSSHTRTISGDAKIPPGIIIITGLLLGLVTTLTGLGGGVLLIPLLLRIFKMSYEDALPTSLSSIFLVSLSSLVIQGKKTLELLNLDDFLLITAGALIAFGFLKFLLKSLNHSQKLKLRKYVFTLATISSLVIVIIKTV